MVCGRHAKTRVSISQLFEIRSWSAAVIPAIAARETSAMDGSHLICTKTLMSTWPHAWVPTPTQKGCSCVRPFCTLVRKSMLACVRAPAAVAVAQWMARQLPWPGISWLEGAMDDDAARCAVGRKASPAAQSVCLELPQRGPGSFAVCHHRAPTVPAGSNSPQLMGTAARRLCARWDASELQLRSHDTY